MLRYLICENPWPVIWGLGGFGALMVILFRATQLVKYGIAALVALALGLTLFLTDALIVTDTEQVESIVYELADSVEHSNVEGVLKHMDLPSNNGGKPGFPLSFLGFPIRADAMEQRIRSALNGYKFDFVRVNGLNVEIREQARTAKAEFKVFASAFSNGGASRTGAGTFNSRWTLIFREVAPGKWLFYEIRSANDRESAEVQRYIQ